MPATIVGAIKPALGTSHRLAPARMPPPTAPPKAAAMAIAGCSVSGKAACKRQVSPVTHNAAAKWPSVANKIHAGTRHGRNHPLKANARPTIEPKTSPGRTNRPRRRRSSDGLNGTTPIAEMTPLITPSIAKERIRALDLRIALLGSVAWSGKVIAVQESVSRRRCAFDDSTTIDVGGARLNVPPGSLPKREAQKRRNPAAACFTAAAPLREAPPIA
jgi:hypothetical protein